jgi:hypothetical protein
MSAQPASITAVEVRQVARTLATAAGALHVFAAAEKGRWQTTRRSENGG